MLEVFRGLLEVDVRTIVINGVEVTTPPNTRIKVQIQVTHYGWTVVGNIKEFTCDGWVEIGCAT